MTERRIEPKSMMLALSAVFLGWLGVDRFINGNVVVGVIKLLTLGGVGIWWLVDIIIFTYRAQKAWAASGTPAARSAPPPSRVLSTAMESAVHSPPAPRGRAVAPWIRMKRDVDVAGEAYRDEEYEQILDGQPRTGQSIFVDVTAALYPDPHNPHSTHGSAVSVWIDGHHAGYLPSKFSSQYSPILRNMAEHHAAYLEIAGLVQGYYQTRNKRWDVQTTLGLPEPGNIQPRNGLPEGDLEIIPEGRIIQVTKEAEHMDVLGPLAEPGEPIAYAVTLRPAWSGVRSTLRTVEVLIDGQVVGEFSSQTGAQTVELVKLIIDAGRIPVARATLEGNPIQVEVKVRMRRTTDFDHDRILELQHAARERRMNTNHRGEAFDWDDDLPRA